MNSTVEEGVLRGRPFGGVMTLVSKRLQKFTKGYIPLHGPDRTRTDFLRPGSPRNSVGSVRVSDKVRGGPCWSARVRSGPCSGILP